MVERATRTVFTKDGKPSERAGGIILRPSFGATTTRREPYTAKPAHTDTLQRSGRQVLPSLGVSSTSTCLARDSHLSLPPKTLQDGNKDSKVAWARQQHIRQLKQVLGKLTARWLECHKISTKSLYKWFPANTSRTSADLILAQHQKESRVRHTQKSANTTTRTTSTMKTCERIRSWSGTTFGQDQNSAMNRQKNAMKTRKQAR